MYHVFLHELGHAHSLGHVMDNNAVMYYAYPPGPTPGAKRRINLTTDAAAYDGGDTIINKSQNDSTALYGCGVSPMRLITSCPSVHTSGIENIPAGLLNFSVYPNPVSGMLTIKYESLDSHDAIVSIYNAIGEIIYRGTITDSIEQNLNTNLWATGLYIITLQTNISNQSIKIIKQ